jgi:Zn-dependent M28 family amino/carboxypeptidase
VRELPEAERARIVANFNTDMIGTAGPDQTQLFVNTLDGDNLVARSARPPGRHWASRRR